MISHQLSWSTSFKMDMFSTPIKGKVVFMNWWSEIKYKVNYILLGTFPLMILMYWGKTFSVRKYCTLLSKINNPTNNQSNPTLSNNSQKKKPNLKTIRINYIIPNNNILVLSIPTLKSNNKLKKTLKQNPTKEKLFKKS